MTDFYQKIVEHQGTVEDILRKIPGFKGYFNMSDRRQADKLVRQKLVLVFEQTHNAFRSLQKDLIDQEGIGLMERVQSIDTKLRTFIDRVESAAQGYSSVFDAVKIREAELQNVYAYDNTLFVYAEQFEAGMEQLQVAIGNDEIDTKDVLRQLDSIVSDANDAFKHRAEAIKGLQESV